MFKTTRTDSALLNNNENTNVLREKIGKHVVPDLCVLECLRQFQGFSPP